MRGYWKSEFEAVAWLVGQSGSALGAFAPIEKRFEGSMARRSAIAAVCRQIDRGARVPALVDLDVG